MRNVKYSGYSGDWGEYVFGYLVVIGKDFYINRGEGDVNSDVFGDYFIEVYEESIGEFTGLKDKNGTDIYEGDILEFDPKEWGATTGNVWAVEWDKDLGEWDTGGGFNGDCKDFKQVIGNIYQNPEILEES